MKTQTLYSYLISRNISEQQVGIFCKVNYLHVLDNCAISGIICEKAKDSADFKNYWPKLRFFIAIIVTNIFSATLENLNQELFYIEYDNIP